MLRRITIWKEVGETPLMALGRWKRERPEYAFVSACYAGRLDPMAEGKLLVLLGEECKRQKDYHGLDKEYEIEVLLDAGSDTGDALGVVSYAAHHTRVDPAVLKAALKEERGTHVRKYPVYSSKTVGGKPLFLHALEGALDTIEIPTHKEHIYAISILDPRRISAEALQERIEKFLSLVPTSDEPSKALGADFRIDAVRGSWERFFAQTGAREFGILRLKVTCGAGTYMRSLAGRIGESLGTNALALSIKRTRIGKRQFGIFFDLPS
jgi:tRNA pseudouridine55 synthase